MTEPGNKILRRTDCSSIFLFGSSFLAEGRNFELGTVRFSLWLAGIAVLRSRIKLNIFLEKSTQTLPPLVQRSTIHELPLVGGAPSNHLLRTRRSTRNHRETNIQNKRSLRKSIVSKHKKMIPLQKGEYKKGWPTTTSVPPPPTEMFCSPLECVKSKQPKIRYWRAYSNLRGSTSNSPTK